MFRVDTENECPVTAVFASQKNVVAGSAPLFLHDDWIPHFDGVQILLRMFQANMKEDMLKQVRKEVKSLQKQQTESLSKITTRDEVLQKLNAELGKLRGLKQGKLQEVSL